MSHTGFPIAPARCATAVSTEITRSSWLIAAAVSAKSCELVAHIVDLEPGGGRSASRVGGPFCSEKKRTPSTSFHGCQHAQRHRPMAIVDVFACGPPTRGRLSVRRRLPIVLPSARSMPSSRAGTEPPRESTSSSVPNTPRQAQQMNVVVNFGKRVPGAHEPVDSGKPWTRPRSGVCTTSSTLRPAPSHAARSERIAACRPAPAPRATGSSCHAGPGRTRPAVRERGDPTEAAPSATGTRNASIRPASRPATRSACA